MQLMGCAFEIQMLVEIFCCIPPFFPWLLSMRGADSRTCSAPMLLLYNFMVSNWVEPSATFWRTMHLVAVGCVLYVYRMTRPN